MEKQEFEKYLKYLKYAAEHYGAFEYENIRLEDDGKITGEILEVRIDISYTYKAMLKSRESRRRYEEMIKPRKDRLEQIKKQEEEWL